MWPYYTRSDFGIICNTNRHGRHSQNLNNRDSEYFENNICILTIGIQLYVTVNEVIRIKALHKHVCINILFACLSARLLVYHTCLFAQSNMRQLMTGLLRATPCLCKLTQYRSRWATGHFDGVGSNPTAATSCKDSHKTKLVWRNGWLELHCNI